MMVYVRNAEKLSTLMEKLKKVQGIFTVERLISWEVFTLGKVGSHQVYFRLRRNCHSGRRECERWKRCFCFNL